MRNFIRIPLTLSAISLLTACGSAIKLDDTPVESRVPVLVGSDSGSAGAAGSRTGGAGAGAGAGSGRTAAAPGAGSAAAGSAATSRSNAGAGSGGAAGAGSGSMAGAGGSGGGTVPGSAGGAGMPGSGGGQGASGQGGVAAAGPGSVGWGSTMGGAPGSSAGSALPSAVGESRLASISTVTPPPIPPRDDSAAANAGGSRVSMVAPPPIAPRDDPAVLPPGTVRIVYFDFDSFVIRNDARPVIEAHARVLTADRARRVVIEGHTDDRGGREYNLALGQKRAEAVLRALVMLGASDAQLEAVSFGKERPAAQGADDAARAQNRRAELRDRR